MTIRSWREIFRGSGGGPRDVKPSFMAALFLTGSMGLPPVSVSPSVGFEPLDIDVKVRSAEHSRSLYVAVTDGVDAVVSSTRDVTPGQVRYNFEFKRLRACECEVVAYSVEPNEIRLIGSRPLIITGPSR